MQLASSWHADRKQLASCKQGVSKDVMTEELEQLFPSKRLDCLRTLFVQVENLPSDVTGKGKSIELRQKRKQIS